MTVGRFKFVIWNIDPNTAKTVNPVYDYDRMHPMLVEMATKYEWSYLHFAQEKAPKTNKAHIDGYYEYPTQRKWGTELKKFVKKFGAGFGDLQTAKGTAGENDDYSTKALDRLGDLPVEYHSQGTPGKGQGARTDIVDKKNAILAGETTVEEIMCDVPEFYHKYGRTLQKIEDLAFRKKYRTEMTQGIWLYGPTGVGKSHRYLKDFNPDTHYIWKQNDRGWQDGYTGQATVIFNEFRGSLPYEELMDIVDKWPYTVPRRSQAPAPFLAKTVVITASRPPWDVYPNRQSEDGILELRRRFKIEHIKKREHDQINFEAISYPKSDPKNFTTDYFDLLYSEV